MNENKCESFGFDDGEYFTFAGPVASGVPRMIEGGWITKPSPSIQKVLDHGEVELLGYMGTDRTIAQDARVSYGKRLKETTEMDDRRLLRYMMRHKHTSPFEMAEVKFRLKMPIFVDRQCDRHRTASKNEISARYAELPNEFFMPEKWRGQDKKNKQGSEGEVAYSPLEVEGGLIDMISEEVSNEEYRRRLKAGVSRELARTCLPLSTYTEFVWKCDLHNTLNFLRLRLDSHAQEETRAFAQAMANEVKRLFPITWEAFEDYVLNAVTLSAKEVEILRQSTIRIRINDRTKIHYRNMGDSELEEFCDKQKRLFGEIIVLHEERL